MINNKLVKVNYLWKFSVTLSTSYFHFVIWCMTNATQINKKPGSIDSKKFLRNNLLPNAILKDHIYSLTLFNVSLSSKYLFFFSCHATNM